MRYPDNKTKIICTIGPATESLEMMEALLRAGMNIARLNFSHGDFSSHGKIIKKLRTASEKTGQRLAIMADLPGPKMRIGELKEEPIELHSGDAFTLTTESIVGDHQRASVTFKELPVTVKVQFLYYAPRSIACHPDVNNLNQPGLQQQYGSPVPDIL